MIHKHIENPKKSSGKSVRLRALLEYISNPDDGAKCIEFGLAPSFISADIPGAIAEMTANSKGAVRSKDTIHHSMVSWPADEIPTSQQAKEAARIFVEHLGFEDHLYCFALHNDTGNRHLHIVIDRATQNGDVKKINRGFTQIAGAEAVARIEAVQGWQPGHNPMVSALEDGTFVRSQAQRDASDLAPSAPQRVVDQAAHMAQETKIARAQARCGDLFRDVKSWMDLHNTLSIHNMRYELKGPGAVIRLADETRLKASSVSRYASLNKLTQRLGPFVPICEQATTPDPGLPRPSPSQKSDISVDETGLAEIFERYHAAIGAERYRVTCRRIDSKTGKNLCMILDNKPGELIGLTPDELRERLPELARLQTRNHDLYLTPLSAQCHHLVIDGVSPEALTRMRAEGIAPAAVLETGPDQVHVVINLARLSGDAFDLEAAGAVANDIKAEFGNPTAPALYCAHPMPGTQVKHTAPAQTTRAPLMVRLVEVAGGVCRAVGKKFAEIYQTLRSRVTAGSHKPEETGPEAEPPLPAFEPLGSDLSLMLYEAHRIDVMRQPDKNLSRLDATIAKRLTATGLVHSEVTASIAAGAMASPHFPEEEQAHAYADRTAEYAAQNDKIEDARADRWEADVSNWQAITTSVLAQQEKPPEQADLDMEGPSFSP